MDITIHSILLPHDDPEASLAFYRDTLGFEVRNDVEYGGLHWSTVRPSDHPGTSILPCPRVPAGRGRRPAGGQGGLAGSPPAPAGHPPTAPVLPPPAATPGITDDERRPIAEMMAKGTYASVNLATKDVDGTFARLQA